MPKKTLKRSTFNPLTHKIKAPEHLSHIQDYGDDHNELGSNFQLPSLQRRKSCKYINNSMSSWDGNSTTASWSPQLEDDTTWKVIQQWEAIERTLFNENEQASQTAVLEECLQWRSQIPHLRVVGKNPFLSTKDHSKVYDGIHEQGKSNSGLHKDQSLWDGRLSDKRRQNSGRYSSNGNAERKVFDMLLKHVISELFPNKENESNTLSDHLSDVLKISPAPIYINKNSARSSNVKWSAESISLEDRFSNIKNKAMEDPFVLFKKEITETSIQGIQRRSDNSAFSSKLNNPNRQRGGNSVSAETGLYRPQTSRNKLGTVFNEKIVVSPVPYVLSTRESFSTVRTTPIKFVGQSLEVCAVHGLGRNISGFRHLSRNSTAMRISNGQSAWHAPVSPAVWPKNIKLAPIDTSRLSSSKNRSLAPSPAVMQRNRKSLSPISRSTLPVSSRTVRNNNETLEIQGKHITPGRSPKPSRFSAGWNHSPRGINNKKKKNQSKEEV